MINFLKSTHQILFFCDYHGHSTKKNCLMYGCKTKGLSLSEQKENIFIRLIPLLFGKKNPWFSYKSSLFKIEKIKESTARVVLFKEFGVLASYTLESSFCGPSCEEIMFNTQNFEEIGKDLCKILNFFRTPRKLKQGVEKLYKGLVSLSIDSKNIDISQAIETMSQESVEYILSTADFAENEESESDSAASDEDDKKIEFKLMNKLKFKKKPKKTIHAIVQSFPNFRPSSSSILTKSASNKKIKSIFNSTAQFRVRKTSYTRIKTINVNNKTDKF